MQNTPIQHFVWVTKLNLESKNKRDALSLKSRVPESYGATHNKPKKTGAYGADQNGGKFERFQNF